ncbi:hypothetical protein ACLECR_02295 [Lonsdalea quercina]|uniref:hypothetical protein n=1 Tax=Lonsdalea quercina TaxID=71657 RepID=UPI003975407A
MKYTEFLSSAKRHNHACRVLKEKLDSLGEDNAENVEYKFLVLSLYYLSGYIIECSIKYKIFELENYDSNSEVNEGECEKAGIDFKNKIKTHNFKRLQNYLDSLISDISHVSEKKFINKLMNEWTPEIRYSSIDVNYKQIKDLYSHTNKFLKMM